MSFALSAGVTGLQAHQKMLDVAGNNLANVNTTAFKASRITFAELLSETIKKASQPTSEVGGTNPLQMGSGVGIAGVSPNMAQGNLMNTGNPLDLAIEGEGYYVLSDGSQDIYSRAGAFGVDADSNLVDPATGYFVQRIGSVGESDGFQTSGISNICVPYDVAMPARATTEVVVSGNLSADATYPTSRAQVIASNIGYTTSNGTTAIGITELSDLDQFSGTFSGNGVITFSGYKPDGTSLASATPAVDLTMDVTATTTLNDVLTWLNTDEGTAGVNEEQTITGTAASGTFTLSYGGETTGVLDWNDTAGDIETALELLTGIDDVTVAGGPLGTAGVTVTFDGALVEETDVALLTVNDIDLAGGTVSVAETTTGRAVQGVLGSEATATLVNGKIVITDAVGGYSKTDLEMAYSDAGDDTSLTMPSYFEVSTVGGDEVKNINITVKDTHGGKHELSAAFVRTGTSNT